MKYQIIFHIDDDGDDIDFFASVVAQMSDAVSCLSFISATDQRKINPLDF
jgi:hypothetical protein